MIETNARELPLSASAALWLFVPALFLSSFLMFLVEPMLGKMVLPLLGGAPAVWNTCVVFFQMTLLAGYAFAHLASSRLRLQHQTVAYVGLLAIPFAVLPFDISASGRPHADSDPSIWLLTVLISAIGLPFFVLSTTASVLQRWFSDLDGRAGRDPYFLYAASNLGSLVALVSYPLIVEPSFHVSVQRRLWAVGYGAFAAVAFACALTVWRRLARDRREGHTTDMPPAGSMDHPPLRWGRRLRWVALAFAPSSLMLAVTSYLSIDIAPVPLLWVAPLSLYLLTFVIAFSPLYAHLRTWILRAMPLVILPLTLLLIAGPPPIVITILIHLLAFFVTALMCHGELAHDRPSTDHLTEFYLWIALGGTLGGVFNTFVAPRAFSSIAEYPIVIVVACLLRPTLSITTRGHRGRLEMVVPLAIGGLTFAIAAAIRSWGAREPMILAGLLFPAVLSYSRAQRPIAFAACIGLMLLAGPADPTISGSVIHVERTFFGVYRVRVDADGRYRRLFHGTTLHGMQTSDPAHRDEPLTYYHRSGPFGQLVAANPRLAVTPEIAVVGLGVGALASYASPGQRWTFYEIDTAVERLSRRGYFTFLEDCGDRCHVVIGDARLSLEAARPGAYGLIVLDAFSSDAIPMHLMTAEAVSLYLSRLAPRGLLAFHISNRHLTLGPILGRLASTKRLQAREQSQEVTPSEADLGHSASHWLVMARDTDDLGGLASDGRWMVPTVSATTPLWTDDFSNILSVLTLD
jgi:hypothetical protein